MKKYIVVLILTVTGIIIARLQKQPRAQDSVKAITKRTYIPMAKGKPFDELYAEAASEADSIKKAKAAEVKQENKDRHTAGNLFIEKQIEKNTMLSLAYQQKMANKMDALQKRYDSLLIILSEKPKIITLQPVYGVQPTQYRGLVPIPQKSNRDRRRQADIRNMYRDSSYTIYDTTYSGMRVS